MIYIKSLNGWSQRIALNVIYLVTDTFGTHFSVAFVIVCTMQK